MDQPVSHFLFCHVFLTMLLCLSVRLHVPCMKHPPIGRIAEASKLFVSCLFMSRIRSYEGHQRYTCTKCTLELLRYVTVTADEPNYMLRFVHHMARAENRDAPPTIMNNRRIPTMSWIRVERLASSTASIVFSRGHEQSLLSPSWSQAQAFSLY